MTAPNFTWTNRRKAPVVHRRGAFGATLCGMNVAPDWIDQDAAPAGFSRCRECGKVADRREQREADEAMVGGDVPKFGGVSWVTIDDLAKWFPETHEPIQRACRIAARRFLNRSAHPLDEFGVTVDGKRVVAARSHREARAG